MHRPYDFVRKNRRDLVGDHTIRGCCARGHGSSTYIEDQNYETSLGKMRRLKFSARPFLRSTVVSMFFPTWERHLGDNLAPFSLATRAQGCFSGIF